MFNVAGNGNIVICVNLFRKIEELADQSDDEEIIKIEKQVTLHILEPLNTTMPITLWFYFLKG